MVWSKVIKISYVKEKLVCLRRNRTRLKIIPGWRYYKREKLQVRSKTFDIWIKILRMNLLLLHNWADAGHCEQKENADNPNERNTEFLRTRKLTSITKYIKMDFTWNRKKTVCKQRKNCRILQKSKKYIAIKFKIIMK